MTIWEILLMVLMFFTAFFLIVLILIQRGKGGGLAGAFGGLGGQSAFGTKAGDLFTRITIGLAAFWIVLCVVSVRVLGTHKGVLEKMGGKAAAESTQGTGEEGKPASDGSRGGADSNSSPAPGKSGE